MFFFRLLTFPSGFFLLSLFGMYKKALKPIALQLLAVLWNFPLFVLGLFATPLAIYRICFYILIFLSQIFSPTNKQNTKLEGSEKNPTAKTSISLFSAGKMGFPPLGSNPPPQGFNRFLVKDLPPPPQQHLGLHTAGAMAMAPWGWRTGGLEKGGGSAAVV